MTGESQIEPENRPDPTIITTEQIQREVGHLNDKLEGVIALGLANLETRIRGEVASQKEQIHRLEAILEERDRRYGERFDAQQLSVDRAFVVRETAVEAAFKASEKAVEAAFKSSQEAVTKAEVSIEKRADSTYVTLTDLQRQLTNLMPRTESEQRMTTMGEAIQRLESNNKGFLSRDEYSSRHTVLQETIASLQSRMDKQEGYSGGAKIDASIQDLKAQVEANALAVVANRGQKEGSNEQRNLMFAFAGFFVTVLTIIGILVAIWPNSPGG